MVGHLALDFLKAFHQTCCSTFQSRPNRVQMQHNWWCCAADVAFPSLHRYSSCCSGFRSQRMGTQEEHFRIMNNLRGRGVREICWIKRHWDIVGGGGLNRACFMEFNPSQKFNTSFNLRAAILSVSDFQFWTVRPVLVLVLDIRIQCFRYSQIMEINFFFNKIWKNKWREVTISCPQLKSKKLFRCDKAPL